MRNKKITFENFFLYFILLKKISSFCNILTFCKAFDSIPDFENLGYQEEIINLFENNQRLHKATAIKSFST